MVQIKQSLESDALSCMLFQKVEVLEEQLSIVRPVAPALLVESSQYCEVACALGCLLPLFIFPLARGERLHVLLPFLSLDKSPQSVLVKSIATCPELLELTAPLHGHFPDLSPSFAVYSSPIVELRSRIVSLKCRDEELERTRARVLRHFLSEEFEDRLCSLAHCASLPAIDQISYQLFGISDYVLFRSVLGLPGHEVVE